MGHQEIREHLLKVSPKEWKSGASCSHGSLHRRTEVDDREKESTKKGRMGCTLVESRETNREQKQKGRWSSHRICGRPFVGTVYSKRVNIGHWRKSFLYSRAKSRSRTLGLLRGTVAGTEAGVLNVLKRGVAGLRVEGVREAYVKAGEIAETSPSSNVLARRWPDICILSFCSAPARRGPGE